MTTPNQQNKAPVTLVSNSTLRYLLLVAGMLSLGLGVLGIFLPLLPTTPFLLLSAACWARSSERFHRWLIEHKYLGPYLSYYLEGRGLPLKAKISILGLLWLTISTSAIFFVPHLSVRFLLLMIATCVTVYILRLPTATITEPPTHTESEREN